MISTNKKFRLRNSIHPSKITQFSSKTNKQNQNTKHNPTRSYRQIENTHPKKNSTNNRIEHQNSTNRLLSKTHSRRKKAGLSHRIRNAWSPQRTVILVPTQNTLTVRVIASRPLNSDSERIPRARGAWCERTTVILVTVV